MRADATRQDIVNMLGEGTVYTSEYMYTCMLLCFMTSKVSQAVASSDKGESRAVKCCSRGCSYARLEGLDHTSRKLFLNIGWRTIVLWRWGHSSFQWRMTLQHSGGSHCFFFTMFLEDTAETPCGVLWLRWETVSCVAWTQICCTEWLLWYSSATQFQSTQSELTCAVPNQGVISTLHNLSTSVLAAPSVV